MGGGLKACPHWSLRVGVTRELSLVEVEGRMGVTGGRMDLESKELSREVTELWD